MILLHLRKSRLLRPSVSCLLTTKMSGDTGGECEFEKLVGITEYTNKAPGFRGILKQRYSDFIVREIGMDDLPSSLTTIASTEVEKKHFVVAGTSSSGAADASGEAMDTDELIAQVINEVGIVSNGVFGAGTLLPSAATAAAGSSDECKQNLNVFLKQCLTKANDCPVYFTACPCADKESRTKVHQIIRKYLPNAVDSEALEVKGAKFIRLVAKHQLKKGNNKGGGGAAGGGDGRNRAPQWPQGLGDYLKFTMLKENVDTMSAASIISRNLRLKPDAIKYAGTKDKRAITSQKCTVYRRKPSDLARVNRFNIPPFIRVGDFEYVQQPLKLGNLRGNHFSIVLRDIDKSPQELELACDSMRSSGFVNYFGLQRFGRGGSKSHEIGRALIKSEWKLAVNLLFTPREGDKDDLVEAKIRFAAKDYRGALSMLPNSLHSEGYVLESLINHPEDYLGAYNRIAKNPRLICIHAYQSYIWNLAASERIRRYGLTCVVGDLVGLGNTMELLQESDGVDLLEMGDEGGPDVDFSHSTSNTGAEKGTETQNSVVHTNAPGGEKKSAVKIHVLTEEDIVAGTYTITDILLPLPGSDSVFPNNELNQYYLDLLAQDEIPLTLFSTCYPQYRSAGAYRRLIQMPGAFQWSCFSYQDPNVELMPTELSYLRSQGGMKNNRSNGNGRNGNDAMEVEENSKYCAKSSDVESTKINTLEAAEAAAATATSSSSSSSSSHSTSANKDIIPSSSSIDALPLANIICSSNHSHNNTDNNNDDEDIKDIKNEHNSNNNSNSMDIAESISSSSASSSSFQATGDGLTGVLLKFTLPPGTYATMMLREITKQGTDSQFQAGLTAQAALVAAAAEASRSAIPSSHISMGDISPDELKVAGELLAMGRDATAESVGPSNAVSATEPEAVTVTEKSSTSSSQRKRQKTK